jgi:hypothetical protein
VPVVTLFLARDGTLSRPAGALLFALFALWMTVVARQAIAHRRNASVNDDPPVDAARAWLFLLALVGGFQLPLAAVQILWINIVTESTLPANLVMDPPDGDEMKRAPVPRNDRLLDAAMLWRIALLTPMAVVATFGWFACRQSTGVPCDIVRTETFTVLAVCQWFNVLNCQSATRSALKFGIFRNRWLMGGLALSLVLQAAVLYWPPLNELFHTVPIPRVDLLPIVAVASAVLWMEESRKLIRRLRRTRTGQGSTPLSSRTASAHVFDSTPERWHRSAASREHPSGGDAFEAQSAVRSVQISGNSTTSSILRR